MLYKSALLTAASGKIRGIVASHNRGGTYFRGLTIPTNPGSSFQTTVRNAMKTLTSRWQETLTSVQRAAWQTYADAVQVRNALGDLITLTGQNMFIRSNISRLQASLAIVDAAPIVFDLGTFTAPTITLAPLGTTGTITFSAADSWNATSAGAQGMLVYQSRAQARSINYYKGPYRFAAIVNGTAGTGTFTSPFTNPGTTNQAFFQVVVTRSDGRLSSPMQLTVLP